MKDGDETSDDTKEKPIKGAGYEGSRRIGTPALPFVDVHLLRMQRLRMHSLLFYSHLGNVLGHGFEGNCWLLWWSFAHSGCLWKGNGVHSSVLRCIDPDVTL